MRVYTEKKDVRFPSGRIRNSLYYFKPDENNQEIEFVISRNAQAIPVEVKARRGETLSLNMFIENRKPNIAYKLIDGNVGKAGPKRTLPHYMALFI